MPEKPRTATQIIDSLTPRQREVLLEWFAESYEDGWRPGIHIPTFAETLYDRIMKGTY